LGGEGDRNYDAKINFIFEDSSSLVVLGKLVSLKKINFTKTLLVAITAI